MRYKILISSLFFLIPSLNTRGQSIRDIFSESEADTIIKYSLNLPENTQVSIAIVREGKVTFGGFQITDAIPVYQNNTDSVFEIGSLSKVFTSSLLALAVKENKLKLDDTVAGYLDFNFRYKDGNGPARLINLSNHTSGLDRIPSRKKLQTSNFSNPYSNFSQVALLNYCRHGGRLNFGPGDKLAYSNTGVAILGYILEKVYHSPYETLLQEKINQRFQLQFTTTDRSFVTSNLVKGLDHKGRITSNWDLNSMAPAGGIYSCTRDLAKYVSGFFDDQILKRQLTETHNIDSTGGIGLALFINRDKNGHPRYWHTGGTGGYSSALILDPDKKNAVIVLSNIANSQEIDLLCFRLMGVLE